MTFRTLGRAGSFSAVIAALGIAVTTRAAAPTGSNGLMRLKAGNARFVANPGSAPAVDPAKRAALSKGQTPFASILTCADSQVPPELVFQMGLGDLFVVRSSGHVADRSVLASLEYAAEHLHVPLLVVMGHDSCSVVRSTLEMPVTQSLGPNLDYVIKAIRPAAMRTTGQSGDARLRAAVLENVEETVNELLKSSAALKRLQSAGSLTLVGAYYELTSGQVHFSDVVAPSAAGAPAAAGAQAAAHH